MKEQTGSNVFSILILRMCTVPLVSRAMISLRCVPYSPTHAFWWQKWTTHKVAPNVSLGPQHEQVQAELWTRLYLGCDMYVGDYGTISSRFVIVPKCFPYLIGRELV